MKDSKSIARLLFLSALFLFTVNARCQDIALKTNALLWGTLTPNLSTEIKLSKRYTTDLFAAYRPWDEAGKYKARFWLAQPELRYWLCESFEGHFFGLHVHGAQYNVTANDKVYDGYLAGAGISYGYQWILSPHWNLEAQVGVGYAYLWYKERPDLPCMKCQEDKHKHYVGPTKLAISFSYIF